MELPVSRGEVLLSVALSSIAADRIFTLLHWGYEANPLVTQLGPVAWVGLTLVAMAGVTAVYKGFYENIPRTVTGFLCVVTLLHVSTTMLNLSVVY